MAARRSRKAVAAAGIVVGLVVLSVLGYGAMAGSAGEVDPSRLITVEKGDLVRSVVATGRIEPISKVEIKSKANGIIEALRVEIGDVVKEGQVLAELDRENLAARLREARAALLGAEANVKAAEADLEKTTIEAEGPEVRFATRNLQRAERLFADGLYSAQELDDVRGALEAAVNRQEAARSQLGVSRAKLAQARAAAAQAAAAAERAAEEHDNATIRSPIHGMVLSRPVEVGSPVSSILNLGAAATPVMVLGDISQVYVLGKVDEADIGAVRLGQAARIRVETFRDRLFDGKVTQISPMGVERDNVVSFEVKVSIDNAGGELRANMTANAEIVLEEHKGTLVIPESAITYDAAHQPTVAVYTPGDRNGGRTPRPITIGISNGTRTQVLSGLREGEKLIAPS